MKTLLHVNYFEGPGKLDMLFKIAKINGCDGVELRGYDRYEGDTAKYRAHVAALKQQYPEFEITFGCPVDYMSDEPDRIRHDEDDFIEFLDWAHEKCGTRLVNFFTGNLVTSDADYWDYAKNGSGMATEEQFQRAGAGLHRLGAELAKRDMLIAMESHNCYLHDLAKPCAKLLAIADCDRIGINYDHGNICINANGEKISEVFDILKGRIYYAHLKNMLLLRGGLYAATHLDAGHIDTYAILKGLQSELKSGMFAIEYSAPGDGLIAAKRDMEYIRFLKEWLETQDEDHA